MLDFEKVFNASPNPYMLLSPELTFVAVNDAYCQVLSRRREEILGRYLFDAFPGNPDSEGSTRMLLDSLKRVLVTRKPEILAVIPYAIERETPEGPVLEERYWSATHTPILNDTGEVAYILQHTVDITEMHELKKALRAAGVTREARIPAEQVEEGVFRRAQVVQEENRVLEAERSHLRRLFQQAPGFIAVLAEPMHIFQLANDAYYTLVGRRDILGKPVREALPEIEGQGFYELLDRVLASGEPFVGHAIRVMIDREGDAGLEEIFVDFVYQPIVESDGSVSGIFVQGNDVTEQIRSRRELEQLNNKLEQRVAERTAELEARNRELQEFAYVVSHDLQEPLRKIHTFADILLEDHSSRLDSEGREFLERIQVGTRRMSTLVKDLLSYSRISMRENEFQTVDLNQVVSGVLNDLQIRLEETGGNVEVQPLPSISADATQMQQLFQNLIDNGLKFHRPGVPPRVLIAASSESQNGDPRQFYRIEVQDNGVGFEPEYADRIFTPFQRLHTRDEYEGNGIGLSICRRIVERHGGTITVESEPDRGTRFIIRLPLRHTEACSGQPSSASASW